MIHLFKSSLLFDLPIKVSFEVFLDNLAVECLFFRANLVYLRITHVACDIRHSLVSDLSELLLDQVIVNLFQYLLVCFELSQLSGVFLTVHSVVKLMVVLSELSGNTSLLDCIFFHLANKPFQCLHLSPL